MRKRRRQKQRAKNAPQPPKEDQFPGCGQAEEQEALDNFCQETEYRLADREWEALGKEYMEWLGISQ